MANLNKQYRISHTEEKIISLVSDNSSVNSLSDFADKFDCSLLKDSLNILQGNETDFKIPKNQRWGSNLSVIKRLSYEEYSFLYFLRVYRKGLFLNVPFDEISKNNSVTRLYNLVNNGLSKTLESLVSNEFLSSDECKKLTGYDGNIVIKGNLCTGKITLLNALLYDLNKSNNYIVVFDSNNELQLDFINNSNNVKVLDIKDLTFEVIKGLSDVIFVSTDLDSEYLEMLLKIYIPFRLIGVTSSDYIPFTRRYLSVETYLDEVKGRKKVKCIKEVFV